MSNAQTDNSTGATGNGFLVGVESPQPRLQADWNGGQGQRPDQQVSQQQPTLQQPPPADQRPAYRWTDEDIENARRQEKEKLYPRIEDMTTQLRQLADEREAEKAERQRLAEEAETSRRTEEERQMEVRDLLARRETEWKEQIDQLNARYDADRAVFQKERELQEAELYRRDRIAQEANEILPELRDFITGATPDEIDASIETMKQRTASVLANLVAAEPPQVPYQPRGAAPTVPPVGPMEQLPSYETLTPEDIKGMSMDDYKRFRTQLLQATSPSNRRG